MLPLPLPVPPNSPRTPHLPTSHRNALRLLGLLDDGEVLYAVLEYAPDGELFAAVEKNGAMTEPLAKSVAWQVLAGLNFLHRCGIAHRDMSLENALVSGDTVKIIDFGLCCPLQPMGDAARLVRGSVGKRFYMAPEVWAGQRPYDPAAADVWSAGVMLFILVTVSLCGGEELGLRRREERKREMMDGREGGFDFFFLVAAIGAACPAALPCPAVLEGNSTQPNPTQPDSTSHPITRDKTKRNKKGCPVVDHAGNDDQRFVMVRNGRLADMVRSWVSAVGASCDDCHLA